MSHRTTRLVIECDGPLPLMIDRHEFTGTGQQRAAETKFGELRRANRNPTMRREVFTRGQWRVDTAPRAC